MGEHNFNIHFENLIVFKNYFCDNNLKSSWNYAVDSTTIYSPDRKFNFFRK